MDSLVMHRPRNVDWKRAAALLYGDLGTSKAYVIGLAFLAAGFSSLPIILAVCFLTAVVCYNYLIICKHYPDGGGVYSAARSQSRLLAVTGALLLVADLTVTSATSAWTAMSYFGIPKLYLGWTAMGLILCVGAINFFGPKHSGSLAVTLAIPMVAVVGFIILLSLPYLSLHHLEMPHTSLRSSWVAFVGVILALSGVESIANLTGVLKLDPGASLDQPRVVRTATKAILVVALEVVIGTALCGWAMLSIPGTTTELEPLLRDRSNDMLRFLAERFTGLYTDQLGWFIAGPVISKILGFIVGLVVGLLLLGAVNTAIAALIGLIYIMARDGEMPQSFRKLNAYGVPIAPLLVAVVLPVAVVAFSKDTESLANLYAIGVVGAITVNLGSCSLNRNLNLRWYERGPMTLTFLVLFAVELTIARTKPDALFFALCILIGGLALRSYSQKRAGLRTVTVSQQVAAAVQPESFANFRLKLEPAHAIMVAARGSTPVLRFAMEEALLRRATLYVLFVREVAVNLPAPLPFNEPPQWQNNKQASEIMYGMLEQGQQNKVCVVPLYAVSENPAATILDLAATMGVDLLILGAPHRLRLARILKGNVVAQVARNLPENIQLLIYG